MSDSEDIKNLKKRAEGGDIGAMQNLALLYELGGLGAVDYQKAKIWWEMAAQRGDGLAMACLSDIAEKGLAGSVDEAEAKRWKDQAKQHGIVDLVERVAVIQQDTKSKSLEEILGKKILVVDDSPVVVSVVTEQLSKAGFLCVGANNGEEALQSVMNDPSIGMIITDLSMPKMNGFEMIAKIRSLPDLTDLPIVVLSSEGNIELIKKGKALGVLGWVLKPPRPGILEKIANNHIGKKKEAADG